MVNEDVAKKLAEKEAEKRDWKCILSVETTNYYVFLPVAKDGELIGNSSSFAVDKNTGKVDLKHFTEYANEQILKEY